jgi:hypothetical protein
MAFSAQFPTFAITNQTGIISQDIVTVTALGGLNSEGGTAVSAVPSGWYPGTPLIPIRRTSVPELGRSLCLLDTFYANGTQIPFSVLRLTGPVAWVGITARCGRNDGFAVPTPGSPDVFTDAHGVAGVQIAALSNTAPGTYTIKLIALFGLLTRSFTFTLVVLPAPFIHQLVYIHNPSFSASGGVETMKVGISVPGTTNVFVNVQITAVGSAGQFISGTSGTFLVNAGGNANNIAITIPLTKSATGQTFSFSATIMVGLTADALTGTSTQSSIFGATFIVGP